MGLDFLSKLLAQYLDKFKVSNPTIFAVVAALLAGVKYLVESGTIPIDPKVTDWILWVVALFLGSRTTSFITPPEDKQ